jgi:group I intron endonuclease
MRISGVYTITNIKNKKIYVGCSINILDRIKNHKISLRNKKSNNHHLQCAWNKYGEENFLFEILEEYPVEYIFSMENYWSNLLDTHNPSKGYNLLPCSPNQRPKKLSESTKIKMSESRRGDKNHRYGTSMSKEHRNLLSKINKNKIVSKETKLKMSIKSKERIRSKDEINKLKSLAQNNQKTIHLLNENKIVKTWNSIKEASQELNLTQSYISGLVNGKRKSKKFNFKLEDSM